MRARLLAILLLAVLLVLSFAAAPAAIEGRPPLSLTECSPPADLQLPVGQGVAVHCRLRGQVPVIRVEFLVDRISQHVVQVHTGEVVSWTWVPAQAGRYTLTVVASAEGHKAVAISRQVMVVPDNSPVRIP